MHSNSIKAFFYEKTFEKYEYLFKTLIGALFYFKAAIQAFYKEWIVILANEAYKAIIYTTKILNSLSNAILANLFLWIDYILLMVDKALIKV